MSERPNPFIERRIVVLEGVEPNRLNDVTKLSQEMERLLEKWGLTDVGGPFERQFSEPGHGATSGRILAESHQFTCSSTWPESGYAEIDLVTCTRNALLKTLEEDLILIYRPALLTYQLQEKSKSGIYLTTQASYYGRLAKAGRLFPTDHYSVKRYVRREEDRGMLRPKIQGEDMRLSIVTYFALPE